MDAGFWFAESARMADDLDWIREGLKKPGKTHTGLAKAMGRAPSAITALLKGGRDLKVREVPVVSDYLEVDPPNIDTIRRVPIGEEFDTEDEDIGDPALADAALRFERRQLEPGEIVEREAIAGLGSGGYADRIVVDGQVVDSVRAVWRVPPDFLHSELRARESEVDILRVDGDSMTPTLLPGDRVLVNRTHNKPSPDGLYLIDDGVSMAVKRLELVKGSKPLRVRIKSDNPLHPNIDEMLAGDLPIIGRVICKVTRF